MPTHNSHDFESLVSLFIISYENHLTLFTMTFLQGHGVANYNLDKPSYAFTASTTEFDDQLIRRDIVTLEAAIMAKGASQQEANRLADLQRNGTVIPASKTQQPNDGNDDESDNNDNDYFISKYRQERLEQWKKECEQPSFGDVIPISRPEWTYHVNEASIKSWVMVCLTADVERTGCIEAAMEDLAVKFPNIKFTTIHNQAAIPNWPEENLPSLFLYRHGTMQHQLVAMDCNISPDQLEWKLSNFGVLDSLLVEEPSPQHSPRIQGYGGSSSFGGTMATLVTKSLGDYDDFDNVD